jgi:hypothetical protein
VRKTTLLFAFVGMLMTVFVPAAVAAGGPTIEHYERAGWTCFDPDGPDPELGVHCFAPGSEAKPTAGVVYFDSADDHFLGTEILRFAGDYADVPCPGSHDGAWEWIGFAWACHHPKGGHSH